jgi:hypothetical protein
MHRVEAVPVERALEFVPANGATLVVRALKTHVQYETHGVLRM